MSVPRLNPLARPEAEALIRLATLAPSGHNTQPWKFLIQGNSIRIYPDFSRRLPVVDPDNHALFISLGCALENLIVAAQHRGFRSEVEYFPPQEAQECLVVHLIPEATHADSDLMRAISERQSTRTVYEDREIPAIALQKLVAASQQAGIQFRLLRAKQEIERVVELVKTAIRHQFSDPAFVSELVDWVRFNPREVEWHQDGLAGAALGIPPLPRWLGKILMKRLATAESQAKQCEKLIRSSSALMVFIAEKDDQWHWVNLGRSFERVALSATALNLKHAHLNMPCEVLKVRSQLQQDLGLEKAQPLLLLRLGYAQPMPRSPRRPLQDVLL
jgi:hypothetical protein